jgi:endoglycosylceramidase
VQRAYQLESRALRRCGVDIGFRRGYPRGAVKDDVRARTSSIGGALALGALLCACGADPGGTAPRCAITAPTRGTLHTTGTRVVDELGRTITLRGVNAGGRSKFAPYAPFDYATDGYDAALAAYLDRAASWGIDVLRVPFSWEAAAPSPGAWDEAYLARFDALLDGAWARGLWTVIDFHQDIYAAALCGDGFPAWTLTDPPAPHHDCPQWSSAYDSDPVVRGAFDAFWADTGGVQTAYRAMWTALIDRERDRAGVIGYEPFNEPSPGTAERTAWEQTTLTPFYGAMAALITARDPGALTFVDTTGFEGVLSSTAITRPAGDGIVLAPHSYDVRALYGGKPDPDVRGRLQRWADLGAAWDVPVLIGEMGAPITNPFIAVHAQRHLDALDALGLGGTWWEYSVATELWNDEDFSIVGADGSDTPVVDELARPFARALAGAVTAIAFDPTTRRWSLTYAPTGDAPTELAVPTRAGPLRIDATGACVDVQDGTVLVQPAPGATSVTVTIEPGGG